MTKVIGKMQETGRVITYRERERIGASRGIDNQWRNLHTYKESVR